MFGIRVYAAAAVVIVPLVGPGELKAGGSADEYRITGPLTHGHLAHYFVHGLSTDSRIPLTLQEGLSRKQIHVERRPNATEVVMDNRTDHELFIQSGEMFKSDDVPRVAIDTLLLPPWSGMTTVRSYCLELSRARARGAPCRSVDFKVFFSRPAFPSRATKIAALSILRRVLGPIQLDLPSPIPLGSKDLDNDPSVDRALTDRLELLGYQDEDILGYAFAINGTIAAADVYASHELFLKMWPSLLRYSVAETKRARASLAISPSTDDVAYFLASTDTMIGTERRFPGHITEEIRECPEAWRVEIRRADGSWVARTTMGKKWNYFAK